MVVCVFVQVIHGLLDRLMQLLECPFTKDGSGYYIQASTGWYSN